MPIEVDKSRLKRPPVGHALKNTPTYNMIRFWGRKPWNLVRAYIESYTKPGEIVLDPFAGCGVVAIESLKTKRRTIYNDLNKYCRFIARTSATPVDLTLLKKSFDKLLANLQTKSYPVFEDNEKRHIELSWLYSTKCPNCGSSAEILSVTYTRIYEGLKIPKGELLTIRNMEMPKKIIQAKDKMSTIALEVYKVIKTRGPISHQELTDKLNLNVRPEEITRAINEKLEAEGLIKKAGETPIRMEFRCRNKSCKTKREIKNLDENDVKKIHLINGIKSTYYFPIQTLAYHNNVRFHKQRPGTESIDKLFTKRNLIGLSIMKHEIDELKVDREIKETLLLVFSAILEHVCKMERPNKKGWGVKTYWIAPIFLERNPLHVFKNRFKSIIEGKKESNKEIGKFFQESENPSDVITSKANVCFLNEDARSLPIHDCSIDYVFTDPEYGDSIQYYELSQFGASWLDFKNDWQNEIVVNPKQGKTVDVYRDMLCEAFKQMYRLLKPSRYITVTFHSREIKYWNALMHAIQVAGFKYVTAVYQIPQKEYTNWLNARNPGEMNGDIYVTFHKPSIKPLPQVETIDINYVVSNIILPEVRQVILLHSGQATFNQLVRGVTLSLINKGLMHNPKIRDLNYIKIFDEHFERLGRMKVWRLKKEERISLLDFIPLDRRIEWIAYSVFHEKGGEATTSDILSAIFITLKNSKTPENKEILSIIKNIAKPAKGREKPFWEYTRDRQGYFPFVFPTTHTLKFSPGEELDHERVISAISQLGRDFSYNVWIGKQEIRRTPELKKYRDVEELRLPLPKVGLDRLKNVDVIWLEGKTTPIALIEVEHTTNIRGGLMRMANIFEMMPYLDVKIFVILPDKRQTKLIEILREPSVKVLLGEKTVYCATYSLIAELLDQKEYRHLKFDDFREICDILQPEDTF